jgi:hypothetical protein
MNGTTAVAMEYVAIRNINLIRIVPSPLKKSETQSGAASGASLPFDDVLR